MSSVLSAAAAAAVFLLPRPAVHQQQQHFRFRCHLLLPLLLLLTLCLASVSSAEPLMPSTGSTTEQSAKQTVKANAHPHPHLEEDLLLAPASSSAPEWAAILAKMTADNPCGSAANYSLCQQCGKSTGDPKAFYMCCVNSDDVRQFCDDFVNHTIP